MIWNLSLNKNLKNEFFYNLTPDCKNLLIFFSFNFVSSNSAAALKLKDTHNNQQVSCSLANNALGGAVLVPARHDRSAAARKMRPQAGNCWVQRLSRADVHYFAVPVIQVAQYIACLKFTTLNLSYWRKVGRNKYTSMLPIHSLEFLNDSGLSSIWTNMSWIWGIVGTSGPSLMWFSLIHEQIVCKVL